MNDTERETPVIFTWADRESSSWWLAAFILLSFLLHSATFFVFHGKENSPPKIIRAAPSIQIICAASDPAMNTPEDRALLEWIAINDPALVAGVQAAEPKGLLDIPYRPSFQTLRTQPIGSQPEPPGAQVSAAMDSLALLRAISPKEKSVAPAIIPQATRFAFSEPLATRSGERIAFTPHAKSSVPLQPTLLLAGVDAEGSVRFAFIQQGCGVAALDAEALELVKAHRFSASASALEWGTVTVAWGDDAFATDSPK